MTMQETKQRTKIKIKYQGSCHCGNVSFQFEHEEITSGMRCNCSICIRKGAVMSDFVIPPDEFKFQLNEKDSLGLYEFDNKVAHHHFCKTCGINPFLQTFRMPEHYRINLGCVDGIDTNSLEINLFDGKSL